MQVPQAEDKKKPQSDFHEMLGRIIDTGVRIVSVIPFTVGRILENFMAHEKAGIKALGGFLLVGGVLLSSDGFYQSFGGKPLFPWFEPTWIGWGWSRVWLYPNFWAAMVASLGIQWVESWTLRGKSPNNAKAEYEEIKHHTVPEKKENGIDLVEVRRLQYKHAGMGERSVLGVFIILMFILDFAATFIVARNPWGRPPTEFAGIMIYNTLTMIAGEVGFALWRKAVKAKE